MLLFRKVTKALIYLDLRAQSETKDFLKKCCLRHMKMRFWMVVSKSSMQWNRDIVRAYLFFVVVVSDILAC